MKLLLLALAALGAVVYVVFRSWSRAASEGEEWDCPDYVEPLHVIEPAPPYEYVRRVTPEEATRNRFTFRGPDPLNAFLYTCSDCGVEFVDPTAHRCPA